MQTLSPYDYGGRKIKNKTSNGTINDVDTKSFCINIHNWIAAM